MDRLNRAAVVAHLREIASLLELRGANRFKAKAFARGARSLEASRDSLERLVEEGRLRLLPGIGEGLAKQIEEMHRTGRSELLDSLRVGLPKGVVDRRYRAKARPLLLAEGLELGEVLAREIEGLVGTKSAHLAGSLRRSIELANDVDLVVASSEPSQTLEAITSLPRVAAVELRTPETCRLGLPDGTRVDVLAVPPEELATAWIHATGSTAHVERLAAIAAERGLRLARSGLFDVAIDRRLETDDEAAVYRALGMSHVPPELREDLGEIEQASDGVDFDLVTQDDLLGFVHCHTTWSDGRASVEAMAQAAEARGARFLTITDHSRAAHYAGGLDQERLLRQWDEIDEVQERVAIRLLKGTEADILADGAIDWPDSILERLDVVIASIHARHRQDEEKMTQRVLRAIRHPVFKIWGHPLGRLVRSRPPIPIRMDEVLDALAESAAAIEISGDPHRLDLEPKWVRLARERNIPFVVSVDAHAIAELDNVRYGVGLARRAGVPPTEVLNTRSAEGFAEAVKPTGGRRRARKLERGRASGHAARPRARAT